MEPSAAGPVIYEGFIPFVLDNLLTFMSTMRKACFIRTVVGLLEQILTLYPLTIQAKSNVRQKCFTNELDRLTNEL